jgi:twinkle protein
MPYSPYNWDKVGIDVSKVRNNKAFCPKCHSARRNKSDRSLFVNLQTGVYKCFNTSCDFRGCVADKPQYQKKKDFTAPLPRLQKISDKMIKWFEDRKISNNTLLRMKITEGVEKFPNKDGVFESYICICFNYLRDEKLINIKFRTGDKKFRMVGGAELIPYNLDAAKDAKELLWVEGEIDCLSCIESNYHTVVSVPNGAAGSDAKLEYIDNCWQEIEHIERHIICVDNDEAGLKLKNALTYRLGAEKCWFVKYPTDELVIDKDGNMRSCKDMNEVLEHFGKQKVLELIANSEQPPLTGVYYAADVAESIFDIYANGRIVGETTHYPEMDKIFKWKRKDINLIIGHGNYGKTQFWVHMMLIKSMYDGWRWGIFCPENYPATDFYIDVIEMYVGKHIDDRMGNKMTVDELAEALEFFNDHFIYVYPDEAHDLETIHTIFRSLILRHGIDGFLIDPWNQLDHIIDNREDLYLSKALKEIKRFALINDVSYNIIAHPKTITPNKDNQLPEVQVFHVAGGVMWNNKIDNIIAIERPNWYSDKTSGLTRAKTHKIKRRRTGGSLGEADFNYLFSSSRYAECPNDMVICDPKRSDQYKKGKKIQPPPYSQPKMYQDYTEPTGYDETSNEPPF